MRRLRRGGDIAPLLWFALAHVAIFAGLFRAVYMIPYSGTGLYYEYAGKVLAGQLPYRDFVLEYPPLALLFFTLPRVLGESFRWYYVWYQVQVVVFDLIALAALYAAARRWALPTWRVLAAYTVAVLAVGPINLHQYDIFPATFTLLAVIWFARGGRSGELGAAVFLALGVMTKVYPMLVAPVFMIFEWRQGRARNLWRTAAAFGATCLLLLLPWLLTAPTSLSVLVNYHMTRGIHLESVYSSIALAARSLGLAWVEVDYSFASWNITGPAADLLARVSGIVLLAVLAAAYALIDRHARNRPDAARDVRFVALAAAFVLVAAMCASKVLSPQYLVWIAPLVPLVPEFAERTVIGTFAIVGLLTYYVFPLHYDELLAREAGGVAPLMIRNGLLIVLAVVLGRSLRRAAAERATPAAT